MVRDCWTDRGSYPECVRSSGSLLSSRACCGKVDPGFKAAEADLQTLRPAVGELNGDRSNRPFGEVDVELCKYGACDFEVQFGTPTWAEPEEADRGDSASRATAIQGPTRCTRRYRSRCAEPCRREHRAPPRLAQSE